MSGQDGLLWNQPPPGSLPCLRLVHHPRCAALSSDVDNQQSWEKDRKESSHFEPCLASFP